MRSNNWIIAMVFGGIVVCICLITFFVFLFAMHESREEDLHNVEAALGFGLSQTSTGYNSSSAIRLVLHRKGYVEQFGLRDGDVLLDYSKGSFAAAAIEASGSDFTFSVERNGEQIVVIVPVPEDVDLICPEGSMEYRMVLPAPRVEFCYPEVFGTPIQDPEYVDGRYKVTFTESDTELVFVSWSIDAATAVISLENRSVNKWGVDFFDSSEVTVVPLGTLDSGFRLEIIGNSRDVMANSVRSF